MSQSTNNNRHRGCKQHFKAEIKSVIQERAADGRMALRVLTAVLQADGGGRRAVAGMSGADTRTVGTETRFPAGTHKQGFKTTHGAIGNLKSQVAYRGRRGDGMQPEEVADVHFLEDAVEL